MGFATSFQLLFVMIVASLFLGSSLAFNSPPVMMSAGTKAPPKICILGGGFGGVYTALKLDSMPWENGMKPEITVVDPKDKFVFLPLLYEFATDQAEVGEVAPRYADLFAGTGVRHLRARAAGVDKAARAVALEEGEGSEGEQRALSYDRLVVAVGAAAAADRIPGVAEGRALPFYTLEDAHALRGRLRALKAAPSAARVVVVGGSYSGVELACSLTSYFGRDGGNGGGCRVLLATRGPGVLRGAAEGNRRNAEKVLRESGVEVVSGAEVAAVDAEGNVSLAVAGEEGPRVVPSDLVIVTAGIKANPLLQNIKVDKDVAGRIITGKSLATVASKDIFALGDNSVVQGENLGSTAQVAFQAADYVAWNIWASFTEDKKYLPFRGNLTMARGGKSAALGWYTNLGEMLTLGSGKATLSSFGIDIDGPIGSLARRIVYIARQPTPHQIVKSAQSYVVQTAALATPILSQLLSSISTRGQTGRNKKQ